MRSMKHRTLTGLGVLALTAGGFAAVSGHSSAQAADRNGKCEKGEFCYNFNSNLKGAWSDYTSSVGDYGTTQPSCYDFKGKAKGHGKCVKNEAGGFWNKSSKPVTIYFNSGYAGKSVTVKPGAKGKMPAAVYNNNASHRIGGGGGHTPPPSSSKAMSQALYVGGGGRLTCGFDGYSRQSGRHEGIDFAKGYGSKVRSLVSGTVVRSANDSIRTLAIYVPSANKTVIYLHSDPKVRVGQKVTRGQVIATEANHAAGATHTHVEMRPGKQLYASKSVDDGHLDNPNPASFWRSQGYVIK